MPLSNLIDATRQKLNGKPNYCFPIPVWGNYYVSQLLNYCLPSLLAEGNLPYLAKKGNVKVVLTTTEEDKSEILNSPLWSRLSALAEVVFDIVAAPSGTTMSRCQNKAFELCGNGYVFFVVADNIFPENGLTVIESHLKGKTEAVQVIVLRIKESGLRHSLKRFIQNGVLTVPQSELNALSFAACDDTVHWRDINGPVFTNWPSSILQKSKKTTCMRFFHLTLMALKNRPKLHIDDNTTFDARFVSKAVRDLENVHTIEDCSVFFMPSTVPDLFLCPTEAAHTDKPIVNKGKSALVETADWARKQADQHEWNNFKNFKIVIGDDPTDAESLLDEAMMDEISRMAKLLNYFEGSGQKTVDVHNLNGPLQEGVDFIIVDNFEPRRLIPDLPSSKTLLSVNGLTNTMGREVRPLAEVKEKNAFLGNVFLQMNAKTMVYLRKILTLELPAAALYTAMDLSSVGHVFVQSGGSDIPHADGGPKYLDAAGDNNNLVRVYDTSGNALRFGFVHGNESIKFNTEEKIEFFHRGTKFAEIDHRHGFRMVKK